MRDTRFIRTFPPLRKMWRLPISALDELGRFPLYTPMDIQAESLLSEIEAFLSTRKIAETTFGLWAVNDGKFVGRLRAGKNLTVHTVTRVREFIRSKDHPDEGASP